MSKDDLKLFKARIDCAVNQLKTRNLHISTYAWRILQSASNGTWIHDRTKNNMHPLAVFIEGHRKFRGEDKLHQVARILGHDVDYVRAFSWGLGGDSYDDFWAEDDNKSRTKMKPYYTVGQRLRQKHV